jgi:hypothetical protein
MISYKALALSALLGVALGLAPVRIAAAQCVPACSPCEVCNPVDNTCGIPQSLGCQVTPPKKSSLIIKKGLVVSNDVVLWKWLASAPITLDGFGDPLTTTSYTLCMDDDAGGSRHLLLSATAPGASHCHGGSCWVAFSSFLRYVDKGALNDGFIRMIMKPGDARRAKIFVKAGGVDLSLPALPYTVPLRVRLLRSDAPTCWEATFPLPTRNSAAKFTAHSE